MYCRMNVDTYPKALAGEWERLLTSDLSAADERQFALLVERQSRFVFRIAYAILRNVEDAEDVVQEIFLKLFRTGAWRGVQDEKAFLARASWRMAVARRPKRRKTDDLADARSEQFSPESAVIEADRKRTLYSLIDSLPEKLREPLALFATEELNAREIAALLSVPEGTVRRRIREARQILKEKIERLGVNCCDR
jgi:RNA polymerase sigma-70 factor (ECF subfamily)